ncbi:hypothetical protein I3843_03G126000 [Carya illinoinensis]|nr:hypothetical protein I3760_03G124000 [Carya illinoinensis]KAG7987283.1 hypothetical protein I3843_03G126000 [Carya illinoinensis]
MEEEDVVIVGAGIAGLATAVALKRVGVRALVLEKSEGLRATGTALGLYKNAWLALDALGIAHKLTATYAPCIKESITNVDTGAIQKFSFAKSEGDGHVFRVIHRKALLEALAEELPVDNIRFSSKLKSIGNQAQNGSSLAIIHLADVASIKAKALVGCDGVHSMVAVVRTHSANQFWPMVSVWVHGLNLEFQQFVTNGKRAGFFLSMIRSSTGLSPTNSPPKVKTWHKTLS